MEYNKVLDSRVDYQILVDNTYSNEDIDRMYELIDSGCNKN